MPKISQLPIQTNVGINSGDSMPIVDSFSGETKQIPMAQLDLRYEGVPNGGNSQQVLAKNTNTNKDVYWKTMDKNSVGLGLVDNTSDANKPISNATQNALNLKANTSALSAKADVTALTSGLATKQDKLPTGTDGDVLTLVAGIPAWTTGGGGGGAVASVFGRIGNVIAQTGDYDKSMIGLDQVDNTSDLDKPISNLTQTALNAKQASLGSGVNGQVLKWIGGATAWVNPVLTTKGDLLGFAAAEVRIPVGTNDQILTADSTAASGVAWKAAPISLPTQTGQSGKFLTTNGTVASWADIPAMGVSATQTLAAAAVITLLAVGRQRVKVGGTGGETTVTLPAGTISGQAVVVQGDDNDNPIIIANSGNVFSNGDRVFFKNVTQEYIWDATQTLWVQNGGW